MRPDFNSISNRSAISDLFPAMSRVLITSRQYAALNKYPLKNSTRYADTEDSRATVFWNFELDMSPRALILGAALIWDFEFDMVHISNSLGDVRPRLQNSIPTKQIIFFFAAVLDAHGGFRCAHCAHCAASGRRY